MMGQLIAVRADEAASFGQQGEIVMLISAHIRYLTNLKLKVRVGRRRSRWGLTGGRVFQFEQLCRAEKGPFEFKLLYPSVDVR